MNEDSDASISVNTRSLPASDRNNYIRNLESEIDIRIDQDFMQLLDDAGVDSNPKVRHLLPETFRY